MAPERSLAVLGVRPMGQDAQESDGHSEEWLAPSKTTFP
jgi:hypothetical protein